MRFTQSRCQKRNGGNFHNRGSFFKSRLAGFFSSNALSRVSFIFAGGAGSQIDVVSLLLAQRVKLPQRDIPSVKPAQIQPPVVVVKAHTRGVAKKTECCEILMPRWFPPMGWYG